MEVYLKIGPRLRRLKRDSTLRAALCVSLFLLFSLVTAATAFAKGPTLLLHYNPYGGDHVERAARDMQNFYNSASGTRFFGIVRNNFLGPDSNLEMDASGAPSFEGSFIRMMRDWNMSDGVPDLLVHINSHGSLDGVATCSSKTKSKSTIPNQKLAEILVSNLDKMQQAGKRFRLKVIQDTCFAGGLIEAIRGEAAKASTPIDIDVRAAAPEFRIAYVDDIRFLIEAATMSQEELLRTNPEMLEGKRGWEWFTSLHRNLRPTTGYDSVRDLHLERNPLPVETLKYMLDLFDRRAHQLPGLTETMQPRQMIFEALNGMDYKLEEIIDVIQHLEASLEKFPEIPGWAHRDRFRTIRMLAQGTPEPAIAAFEQGKLFTGKNKALAFADALRLFPESHDLHEKLLATFSDEELIQLMYHYPDFYFRGHVARFIDSLSQKNPNRFILMTIMSGDSSSLKSFLKSNPENTLAAMNYLGEVKARIFDYQDKLAKGIQQGTDFTQDYLYDVSKHMKVALEGVTLDQHALTFFRQKLERDPVKALEQAYLFGMNDPRVLELIGTEEVALRILIEGNKVNNFQIGVMAPVWFQTVVNEHVDGILESEAYANSLDRKLALARNSQDAINVAIAYERVSMLGVPKKRFAKDALLKLLVEANKLEEQERIALLVGSLEKLEKADRMRLLSILAEDPRLSNDQIRTVFQSIQRLSKQDIQDLIGAARIAQRNRKVTKERIYTCAAGYARIGRNFARGVGYGAVGIAVSTVLLVFADQMSDGGIGFNQFILEKLDEILANRAEPQFR